MQITFKKHPISEAPLAVLQHLYYYTTQYGLSVRQFTGKHWRYWEELPNRLRKAQGHGRELNSIIGELDRLAKNSEDRLKRRQAQIKEGKWEEKEIVLNAQLLSVLAALPEKALALGFKKATGSENLPSQLHIVDLVVKGKRGEDTDFLEPDLLLLGDRHLLMVEIKTRGGEKSSRDYPPHQLLNYLQLVARCRDAHSESLPNKFTHLILVPSPDSKWLENHSKWVIETRDAAGRMRVDPDACIRLSKKKGSYDYNRLGALEREIPIYYRSWQELYEAFGLAIKQFNDKRNHEHWKKVCGEIGELATRAGRYV